MFVDVHKSLKKADTYVYVPFKSELNAVLPEILAQQFAKSEKVMSLNLSEKRELARLSSDKLMAEIEEKGYYLQMPLLEPHKPQPDDKEN
jgi:uncharacterized protein YcgL (UPF0745 family)